MAWVAMQVYEQGGLNNHLAEFDPQAVQQMRDAQAELFAALDPQVQLSMLPAYTKVAVRTGRSNIGDKPIVGQVRDCAWGAFNGAAGRFDRRITTTGGWELMTTGDPLDNPVTELRVLTEEEWEAAR